MTLLGRVVRRGFLVIAFVVMAAACTSGDSDESAGEAGGGSDTTTEAIAGESGEVGQGGTDQPERPIPLGFDQSLFEVPFPEVDGRAEIVDSVGLLDAGVATGVWTEAEGVRAIVSILLGELPPDAVPAFDLLLHRNHGEILTRAESLLEGDDLDPEERADLVRLTSFFFSEPSRSLGYESTVEDPVSARFVAFQTVTRECGEDVGEKKFYGAVYTGGCYNISNNGDRVLVPADSGFDDPTDEVFAMIDLARGQYELLSNNRLPSVSVLISPLLDPDSNSQDALGHMAGYTGGACRIVVFGTNTFFGRGVDRDRAADFDITLAHELFHCVQDAWIGEFTEGKDEFVHEGGANFFAYQLVGTCEGHLPGHGPYLDIHTAQESLLTTTYSGWFFWAFLADYGYLSLEQINQAHQAVKAGEDIEDVLVGFVEDLPRVLNEFYVRMVGPGLACGFKGGEMTDTIEVDEAGPVDLDAQLWVGTRYLLRYGEERLFEQSDPVGGPIGMAPFDKRRSASDWVVVAPEVRSKCEERKEHVVVVTARVGDSELRSIEVDAVKQGACDPCLLGGWLADIDTLDEFYEVSAGQNIELAGSVFFEFLPFTGSTAQMKDQRQFALTLLDSPIPLIRDGEGTATYSADEESLSVTGYSEDGSVQVQDFGSPFAGLGGDDGFGTYSCDADDLEVFRGGVSFMAKRDPKTPEGDPYFPE